jgi:hypothetical protein
MTSFRLPVASLEHLPQPWIRILIDHHLFTHPLPADMRGGGKTPKAEVKRHGIPYRRARWIFSFCGCGAAAAWNLFDYISGVLYACGVTPKPSLLEPGRRSLPGITESEISELEICLDQWLVLRASLWDHRWLGILIVSTTKIECLTVNYSDPMRKWVSFKDDIRFWSLNVPIPASDWI